MKWERMSVLCEFKTRQGWTLQKEMPEAKRYFTFAVIKPLRFDFNFDLALDSELSEIDFRLVYKWTNTLGKTVKAFYEEV